MSAMDQINEAAKKEPGPADQKSNEIKFWSIKYEEDEETIKSMRFDDFQMQRLLYSFGFLRLDRADGSSILAHCEKGSIFEEINKERIIDQFDDYLKGLKYPLDGKKLDFDYLKSKELSQLDRLFAPAKLNRLRPLETPIFATDGPNYCQRFFKSKWVYITADKMEVLPYEKLNRAIWKSTILDRDIITGARFDKAVIYDFILKVAGNESRANDLMIVIGYLMHNYFDGQLSAIVLTDSTVSESAMGRTGKSLIAKILSFAISRNPKTQNVLALIDGKKFDQSDRFRYQKAGADTRIICLNDVDVRRFHVDKMFNDIVESTQVEKKNAHPYDIYTKYLITVNETFRIEGDSAKARFYEFELSNFFSAKKSPQDVYKHWFFKDWDVSEWARFDQFINACIQYYLKAGKLPETKEINLSVRKMRELTSPEFCIFMEEMGINFAPHYNRESDRQFYYEKDVMHGDFLRKFPDFDTGKFKLSRKKFTQWIRTYTDLNPKFEKSNPDTDEFRDNDKTMICFRKAKQ